MRVGIIALLHESNTFISQPTTFEHFKENMLLTGESIRQQLADAHHEIGGFFAGLAEEQITAVPIFAARAVPYGTIDAETFARLLEMMFAELERAGELDGILVAPHGATVSELHRDVDGYWLAELRRRVGNRMPIIGTLDPHANLSALMVDATDALVAYRSNPHLDQRARGMEAANLMAKTLQGKIKPTQAAAFPPLAINIERQLTSEPHLATLYQLADDLLLKPSMLSNSILLGFPYADVEEMGSAVLAVADGDAGLAAEHARQLGEFMWNHRDDFLGHMIGMDEALEKAAQLPGPICLLDMGDNVGGGSPADSTHLMQAIRRHGVNNAFVCLYDPESVAQAAAAGIGSRCTMRVGGKTDELHGQPLEDEFTVLGLYDGKFVEPQPRHGGFTHCDQGPSAVVVNDSGLTILLTSLRMPPFSLQQLISCDLDPSKFHILVAKGVNAPVAAYQPVCKHLIRVNSPGCTTADMTILNFQHRRRPMFPFESETSWLPCAYQTAVTR